MAMALASISRLPSSSSCKWDHSFFASPLQITPLPFTRSRKALGPVAASALDIQTSSETASPRLKALYFDKVVPAMKEEFKYTNIFQVPKVEKIVVNCGSGEAAQNAKVLESVQKDISLVTGQRPVVTRSKKAIAGFKLREGVPVGVAVTLRGEVMYSFLDRLANLALPRTRDFQGVNPYSFDGKGNYTLGFPELSVFPEIKFENMDKERGMDVSIITTAKTDKEGQKLLTLMGLIFKEGVTQTVRRKSKVGAYKPTKRVVKKKK